MNCINDERGVVRGGMERGRTNMTPRFRRFGLSLTSVAVLASFIILFVIAFASPFVIPARAATTWDVSIEDNFFPPDPLPIQIGDTVKWTNNGFNFHTVTSDGGAGPLDSATLGHLGTYSFTSALVVRMPITAQSTRSCMEV